MNSKTQTHTNLKLISAAELAEKLNVSKSWVYQASHSKSIPCYKIGGHLRFDLEEVKEWIKERRK